MKQPDKFTGATSLSNGGGAGGDGDGGGGDGGGGGGEGGGKGGGGSGGDGGEGGGGEGDGGEGDGGGGDDNGTGSRLAHVEEVHSFLHADAADVMLHQVTYSRLAQAFARQ